MVMKVASCGQFSSFDAWNKDASSSAGKKSAEITKKRKAERVETVIEFGVGPRVEVRETHAIRTDGVRRTTIELSAADGAMTYCFASGGDGVPGRVELSASCVEGLSMAVRLEIALNAAEDRKNAEADRKRRATRNGRTDIVDVLCGDGAEDEGGPCGRCALLADARDELKVGYFHRALDGALAGLGEQDRWIFESVYFMGRPKGEVAKAVGKANSTLSYHLGRIRSEVRAALEEQGIDADYFG